MVIAGLRKYKRICEWGNSTWWLKSLAYIPSELWMNIYLWRFLILILAAVNQLVSLSLSLRFLILIGNEQWKLAILQWTCWVDLTCVYLYSNTSYVWCSLCIVGSDTLILLYINYYLLDEASRISFHCLSKSFLSLVLVNRSLILSVSLINFLYSFSDQIFILHSRWSIIY